MAATPEPWPTSLSGAVCKAYMTSYCQRTKNGRATSRMDLGLCFGFLTSIDYTIDSSSSRVSVKGLRR